MFCHHSTVTVDDFASLAREVDPTAPGGGSHLNFDNILRRCGHAWMSMLGELGGFGADVIVPRLEVDYHREVDAGDLEIEVSVITIGTTSFRLQLDVKQERSIAARVQVVLVNFDYQTKSPKPLTDAQRESLQTHKIGV